MYMIFSTLTAISPVDGRYRNKAENLAAYFSEYALIKYRVQVEIEYFITLSEFLPQLRALTTGENKEALRKIYREFSVEDATRIKEIESVTNHDVKAVEYFIKEKFDLLSLQEYKEFIHFGLTSQDINNTSVPLSIKDALNEVYFPGLQEVIDMLKKYAEDWADVPMLAKTHGQPASPTRLGKEVMVFVYRLEQQVKLLKATPVSAKFGGATGNFNAHHVAFPEYDWKAFGNKFVNEVLGLSREESKRNIMHLSVGQRHRMAVGRALVAPGRAILADEPTGSLDPEMTDEVIDLLRHAAHQLGKCVIVVTHSKRVADSADAVYTLRHKKLAKA